MFVHLHTHSHFSFLDGASSPEALVLRAKELGMEALALTDHHGLYGAVRFLRAAKAQGIKPIFGAEITVQGGHHLILLAQSRLGYANLCRIITKAHLDHQDDPWISLEELAPLAKDLFAILPQRCGAVGRHLLSERGDLARRCLADYVVVFGRENLFLELQNHLLLDDGLLNYRIHRLAEAEGLRCVATGNAHYARQEEYRLQDLVACIRHGITVETYHPRRKHNDEYNLKSAEEMASLFAAYPEALRATEEIAARCNVDLAAKVCRPPHFPVPQGQTPTSYLRSLCLEGAAQLYSPVTPQVLAQLERELGVIERLDLAEFFLVVWDICRFARGQGIRYAGRGSAANSLVAYLLRITAVDPLEHNLLFERFLHEELIDRMPDIDIDFDSARRREVVEYVEGKYTPEHCAMVANVITYQTRLAVREAAKALGFPMHLVDRIAQEASNYCPQDVRGYLEGLEELRGSGPLEELVSLAQKLVDTPRHLGLHNGGVLITREPLTSVVPVEISTNGVRVCQLNKDDVEALGLIKFDLLGLKNLTIIEEAVRLIKESRGLELDIDNLPYDDQATYDLLCSSQTIGVFQLESPGQWNLLSRTQPRCFGDLVIQVALFRPGPLQGQMVNPYVARRQDRQPVTYLHPCLEPILKDTLGVLLFQEQVLEIAHRYAGLSYAEADGFRRAISHYRVKGEMEGMRERFLAGADRLGRPREVSEELFQQLSAYTGYGFCRSHAAAFARTVYQTAYLKAHYPAEFLAAVLSNEPCDFFPAHVVLHEAKRLGIKVLPVEINRSGVRFGVEAEGEAIRMGLMQVKGVGEALAQRIAAARGRRPFRSLEDFCRRVSLSREAVANLIQVGAFDGLCPHRRKLLWQLDEMAKTMPQVGERRGASLELEVPFSPLEAVPELPEVTPLEEAGADFSLQGMSARYHPMGFYRERMKKRSIRAIGELSGLKDGQRVVAAGVVVSRQRPPTARGMAFVVLEDETGRVTVAVPPPVFEKYRRVLAQCSLVVVKGVVQKAGSFTSVLAREAESCQL